MTRHVVFGPVAKCAGKGAAGMPKHWTICQNPAIFARPATFLALTAITGGILIGLWLRPVGGRGWHTVVPAAALVLLIVLLFAWQARTRALRRLKSAVDTFAKREIARLACKKALSTVRERPPVAAVLSQRLQSSVGTSTTHTPGPICSAGAGLSRRILPAARKMIGCPKTNHEGKTLAALTGAREVTR